MTFAPVPDVAGQIATAATGPVAGLVIGVADLVCLALLGMGVTAGRRPPAPLVVLAPGLRL